MCTLVSLIAIIGVAYFHHQARRQTERSRAICTI